MCGLVAFTRATRFAIFGETKVPSSPKLAAELGGFTNIFRTPFLGGTLETFNATFLATYQ